MIGAFVAARILLALVSVPAFVTLAKRGYQDRLMSILCYALMLYNLFAAVIWTFTAIGRLESPTEQATYLLAGGNMAIDLLAIVLAVHAARKAY